MRVLQKFGFLTGIALGCALSLSTVHSAEAAQGAVISLQQGGEATVHSATPVYYTWHKKRYAYRYRNRYYNHRSRKNGQWYYY